MMHCMLHWMTSLQFVHSHVCVHNQGNINNWECATQKARYCMVLLLQQYWLELVSRRNWEFYRDFSFYGGTDGDWHLQHVLEIWSYVVNELPEDGTFMPKHIAVGT